VPARARARACVCVCVFGVQGVWVYTLIIHRWVDTPRRKDFIVMYIHHVATIWLVGAYLTGCACHLVHALTNCNACVWVLIRCSAIGCANGFHRISVVILAVHDTSDILIDMLKIVNLLGVRCGAGVWLVWRAAQAVVYVAWCRRLTVPRACSWWKLRLCPTSSFGSTSACGSSPPASCARCILTSTRTLRQATLHSMGCGVWWPLHLTNDRVVRVLCCSLVKPLDKPYPGEPWKDLPGCLEVNCYWQGVTLLTLLQCLHVLWTYILLRIAYKLLAGHEGHKVGAEEYEGASDSEVERRLKAE